MGSKFFVEGFAQSVRKELVKDNIRVTVVAPGAVNTEVFDNSSDKEVSNVFCIQKNLINRYSIILQVDNTISRNRSSFVKTQN